MLDFRSDNEAPAAPEMLSALAEANEGRAAAYGGDAITQRAVTAIRDWFEAPQAEVVLLASGTAANALALAQCCPPWRSVLCHEEAHIRVDECGAPSFFAGGLTLTGLPSEHGRIDPAAVTEHCQRFGVKGAHEAKPGLLSITQATEWGTVYTPQQIAALAATAHERNMLLHLDGARFANALLSQSARPADMSWRVGADVLSLGATKCGAMTAEALIVFDPERCEGLAERVMRGGHLLSKQRFIAAQWLAWLKEDRWARWAGQANAAAQVLGEFLQARGASLYAPVMANEVFAEMPQDLAEQLRAQGLGFHPWPGFKNVYRFVCSWNAEPEPLRTALAALD